MLGVLQMVKKYIKKSLEFLILFILCLCLGLLINSVFQYIPNILGFSLLAKRIFWSVFDLFLAAIPMFLYQYWEGYRSKSFDIKPMIPASILVFVLQQIFAPMLQYAPYVAGTVFRIAKLIHYWDKPVYDNLQPMPPLTEHLLMTGATLLLFIPAMILGEYIGMRVRKKHEEEMKRVISQK